MREPATTHGVRVLLVDDDRQHCSLVREILDPSRYLVHESHDGASALKTLQSQPVDVVVLDKRMPGMGGDEVCRRIRGPLNQALLPILMVTGAGGQVDLADSLRAGATDFLRKPYFPAELVARIDAAVRLKRTTDELACAEGVLFTLARMMEAKDKSSGNHCARLGRALFEFGEALGLAEDDLTALRRASVLHDIGNLSVPDNILMKPGPLTEEEWRIVRRHPEIGALLCAQLKTMHHTVPIVRHHHERWNGSGYPDALAGEQIPRLARIFQIVDIYDTLTHERPYKKAWPMQTAMDQIHTEASQGLLDAKLANQFEKFMGSRIETGETGTQSPEYELDMGQHIPALDQLMDLGAVW